MADILTPSIINTEGILDKQLGLTISCFTPDYIVEVGTFDGEGVKKFGNYSPRSGLVAFEGNPYNYFKFCIGKPVHNLIVSDVMGVVTINQPTKRTDVANFIETTGLRSSSIKKVYHATEFKKHKVISTTLDNFFAIPISQGATFVLILDVEGAAWEVLKGAEQFLKNTIAVKAEVERIENFHGQKLLPDVEMLLQKDFIATASTELRPGQIQHNRYYSRRNSQNVHGYFRSVGAEAQA